MASPLVRHSAAEQIAAHVREQILSGVLRSGDPLREVELAANFGVARNTVREALRLLTRDGLASHEIHRGVTVRRFTPQEIRDAFGVRRMIEQAAADRAGALSAEEIAELQALLNRSAKALERSDVDELLTLNLSFHRCIAALPGNQRALALFDQMTSEILLMVGPIKDDMTAVWLERNRELFGLLRDGRGNEYRAAIGKYLSDAEQAIAGRRIV